MADFDYDTLAHKFCCTPLPDGVCADPCATMPDYAFPRHGTNLLSVAQAKEMLTAVLADEAHRLAQASPAGEVGVSGGWSFNADTRDIECDNAPVFKVYEADDFPCIEDDERAPADKWYDAQAQTAVLMLNSLLHDSGDDTPVSDPSAASAGVRDAGREAIALAASNVARRWAEHYAGSDTGAGAQMEKVCDAIADEIAALTARPDGGEAEAVAWCSPGQLANLTDVDKDGGVYLPIRKTQRGNFTMPLYAWPPTTATGGADREAALEREIAELKQSVVAFAAPWAATYARDFGLPAGHLHPVHYDILAKCGARMDDFTRAALDTSAAKDAGK